MERATPPGRSELPDLLAASRGYAVFDRHGKRVGGFIEPVGSESEEIAIRQERVFLAHRRVLPSSMVAAVLPEDRAVVLSVDRRALARPSEPESHASDDPQDPPASENWQHRIASYVSVTENDAERNADPPNTDSHLLFASTPDGYKLIEHAGTPPAPFDEVELPEHDALFQVVKLADSPLPNDRRVCAYLEPAGRQATQEPG